VWWRGWSARVQGLESLQFLARVAGMTLPLVSRPLFPCNLRTLLTTYAIAMCGRPELDTISNIPNP
jgi:hypothetical protein